MVPEILNVSDKAGGALILPADHPLAQQAFQNQ